MRSRRCSLLGEAVDAHLRFRSPDQNTESFEPRIEGLEPVPGSEWVDLLKDGLAALLIGTVQQRWVPLTSVTAKLSRSKWRPALKGCQIPL